MNIELLVEGYTDEIFVRRCYENIGIGISTVYGKRGVGYVLEKAQGFAMRGPFAPILILADRMDISAACTPAAARALVPNVPPGVLVRLAVNEIEAWLIASRRELAQFLGVSVAHVPARPDEVADPKQELVNLARRSSRSRIRQMFVPSPGVSAVVGQGYVDGFSEFMATYWSLESAAQSSPSFAKFLVRSRELFLP